MSRRTMSTLALVPLLAAAGACADDPMYVQPRQALEVGAPDSELTTAEAQVTLPIRLERVRESEERAARAAELGVEIPYVRRDDLSISLEWTIKNLSDTDGVARIFVNGANTYFSYVPQNFVVDPEEDEEPPPLMGDIPLIIPALATRSGVFREDQVAEAALDLELITRGGLNPFAAVLQVHGDLAEIGVDGAVVPAEAFAHLIRFDLSFTANRHMVLEYAVRVRDHRRPTLLHDELLDAPAEELTQFAPAEFTPPPPAE